MLTVNQLVIIDNFYSHFLILFPTEELKTCGRPPRITSGRPINVDEHRYKHNETVDYECTGKITIPGPVTARCLHGKWELPLCTGKQQHCK